MDFGNISYAAIGSTTGSSTSSSSNDTSYRVNEDFDIDKNAKSVLKDKRITIDPGHGGSDSGAIGPTGVREKDPTLCIGLNLAEMLKQSGAKVYITRKQIQMLLHSLQLMWKNYKRV